MSHTKLDLETIHLLLEKATNRSLPTILPTTTLRDLGLDSLDMVQLMLMLEERLDARLPDSLDYGISTFGELVSVLDKGDES